jgi:hypothetical protein
MLTLFVSVLNNKNDLIEFKNFLKNFVACRQQRLHATKIFKKFFMQQNFLKSF